MTSRSIEEHAIRAGISNKEAKRHARKNAKKRHRDDILVVRGAPVAGTGKPKGD